jgi:integrase
MTTPTLAEYLAHWLDNVVKPNLQPATFAYYEVMARVYIIPGLGTRRLDQLQVSDVQAWLDGLPGVCQCCAQGKDAARPEGKRRCCTTGACCKSFAGRRTAQAARNTLRVALNHAIASGEPICGNVAALATVPGPPRRRKATAWTAEEACRFLASARDDSDPLFAAYVLVLINALRKGEVLGLTWPGADFGNAELDLSWQLQRVGRQLIHQKRETTVSAEITLPMPGICQAALQLRRNEQDAARRQAGGRWRASDLVFTTRWGTPVEPRNFTRSFEARCARARVPRIRVRDARHTCAPLLEALGVDPSVAIRILAHAKITMTTKARAQVPDEVTHAALNKLGGSLDGQPHAEQDRP